jgi:hypothetical protein
MSNDREMTKHTNPIEAWTADLIGTRIRGRWRKRGSSRFKGAWLLDLETDEGHRTLACHRCSSPSC